MNAKMAPDLLRREPVQVAMNPASVVWPEWQDEPAKAQQTRRARRADEPVTIINKETDR